MTLTPLEPGDLCWYHNHSYPHANGSLVMILAERGSMIELLQYDENPPRRTHCCLGSVMHQDLQENVVSRVLS